MIDQARILRDLSQADDIVETLYSLMESNHNETTIKYLKETIESINIDVIQPLWEKIE